MTGKAKVTVLCEAFNQADYIRSALDGFVMQETDFPYTVYVHDDASTDGTADIIREYESRYPEIIHGIYQTENQYSQDVNIDMEFLFPKVEGEYFAFCEGDDYWTDPHKLQKQVHALDTHPECDICAHACMEICDGRQKGLIAPKKESCVIPADEVIRGGGGFVATASLMVRASINEYIPDYRAFYHNDYSIQIQGALRGGMLYLSDCMAAYRYLAKGAWSSGMWGNRESKIRHAENTIRMLRLLEKTLEGKYRQEIQTTVLEQEFSILKTNEQFKKMMEAPYDCVYKALPFSERMKIRVKRDLPFLWELRKRRGKR